MPGRPGRGQGGAAVQREKKYILWVGEGFAELNMRGDAIGLITFGSYFCGDLFPTDQPAAIFSSFLTVPGSLLKASTLTLNAAPHSVAICKALRTPRSS
jgi:hypothetical protein